MGYLLWNILFIGSHMNVSPFEDIFSMIGKIHGNGILVLEHIEQ
jgi:hypothetical protein